MEQKTALRHATRFVVLIGFVSLFADMTYEAARSINGQYLALLGVSGATVGLVAGLGELLGYGLRIVSGYISDKTRQYWLIVIAGYTLNLISVPLLAFAGQWQLAVVLMMGERIGKAVRNPARDAMLSYAGKQMGRGWAFGLHEALDSTGATLGPLLVAAALYFRHHSYAFSYAILVFPAAIAIAILLYGKSLYPNPQDLEIKETAVETAGYPRAYWLFVLASVFIAAGYADFSLIAFHFKKNGQLTDETIPIVYSLAMLTEGIFAVILGKLYDRLGLKILAGVILVSLFFAPLVFLGNSLFSFVAGMLLWGIGMAATVSIFGAEISHLIPAYKRGRAFGTFHAAFGISWFLGSALMGFLYDYSPTALVSFSVLCQLASLAVLLTFILKKRPKKTET